MSDCKHSYHSEGLKVIYCGQCGEDLVYWNDETLEWERA